MTEQWSERSTVLSCKTLSPPDPLSYLRSLALRIWTSFWRREGSAGMDVERSNGAAKTAFDIQVDRKRGPGRPKMTWKQLTEGLQRAMEALGYRPSYLEAMHAASQLPGRGAHWCGCCPCICTLIKNPMMMMMMMSSSWWSYTEKKNKFSVYVFIHNNSTSIYSSTLTSGK